MPTLFDPIQVGALQLANRVVMAPVTRNRAVNAIPPEMAVTYYTQRATAGLLITEGAAINPQSHGYSNVPGLYTSEQLDGWKRVTDAVHQCGGKIAVQLWHVGRISHVELQPGHAPPVGPSAITAKARTALIQNGVVVFTPASKPRALELEELPGIVHDFQVAARNAVKSAGFDGVEIHAANGYLLDQFLKTGSNQRTDDYGGSIENRVRLTLEVVRGVVDAVGPGRCGIRLSPVTPANDAYDADPQPLFEYLVRRLARQPLAYIHVIEGSTGGAREIPDRPFDYAALYASYRAAGGQAAWMVNNGYDKQLAEQALAAGADLVSFGRAFISNPDLVRRLREDAPLTPWDTSTFYGGGAKGYIDYPALPSEEHGKAL